ncbi:MAG: glycosyltransferase [Hydrogenibacillus schlegelii]|uniref:Glycosyltransferase n=1 Tax=Hydrogenibacillus schlegelii TaxID=1484 RepID=A0A947CWW8_HYDSH|nr:glycosyltransferase [Hydrogenibacillus schlegelii]
MRPTISLAMIARDEAASIGRAIRSAAPIVDEVVVGDTGSTDGTPAVARAHGARVIAVPWQDDFAAARNAVLEAVRGTWVFVLDADEGVVSVDRPALEAMLERPDVFGGVVEIRHHLGARPGAMLATDAVLRLFRRDPRIRYRGRIHEDVTPSITALPGARIVRAPVVLEHFGYLEPAVAAKRKNERNLALVLRAIADAGDDPRLWYALGTEWFQRGDVVRAAAALERAFRMAPPAAGYGPDLAMKLLFSLRQAGRLEEALRLKGEVLARYPGSPELWALAAELLLSAGRPAAALRAVRAAREAEAAHRSAESVGGWSAGRMVGSGTFVSDVLAGQAWEALGRPACALRHYLRAVRENPRFLPAWGRLAALGVRMGRVGPLVRAIRRYRDRWAPEDGIPSAILAACRTAAGTDPAAYAAIRQALGKALGEPAEAPEEPTPKGNRGFAEGKGEVMVGEKAIMGAWDEHG